MTSTDDVYDRQKLYDEVWAEPLRDVARRHGGSDVALGKHCRKLGIPLPGRGYWARKAVGRVGKRPPLPTTIPPPKPPPRGSTEEEIRVAIGEGVSQAARRWAACALGLRTGSPGRRARLHAVANDTRYLRRPLWQRMKDGPPRHPDAFQLNCTDHTLERALRLIDGLVRICEKRGMRFGRGPLPSRYAGRFAGSPSAPGFLVGSHVICVDVRERVRRLRHDRSRRTKTDERGYSEQGRSYIDIHTGDLVITVASPAGGIATSDTPESALEERLSEVAGLIERASAQWEAAQTEAAEASKRRAAEEGLAAKGREKLTQFLKRTRRLGRLIEAAEWTDRARRFIDRMRPSVASVTDDAAREDLTHWLEWGLRVADYLDPAVNPKIIENSMFTIGAIASPDDQAIHGLAGVAFPGYPPLE